MSEREWPLHVRVAAALGCNPVEFELVGRRCGRAWACQCPGAGAGEAHGNILGCDRYDTDWSATGPLLGRFMVTFDLIDGGRTWEAVVWDDSRDRSAEGLGATHLLAVCDGILKLSAAGSDLSDDEPRGYADSARD